MRLSTNFAPPSSPASYIDNLKGGLVMVRMRIACLAVGMVVLLARSPGEAGEKGLVKKTRTFKTVDGLDIKADVYRADDEAVRPAVVWIHGGALMFGGRGSVPKNLLDLCKA